MQFVVALILVVGKFKIYHLRINPSSLVVHQTRRDFAILTELTDSVLGPFASGIGGIYSVSMRLPAFFLGPKVSIDQKV